MKPRIAIHTAAVFGLCAFVPTFVWAAPLLVKPSEGATVSIVKDAQKAFLDKSREERRTLFANAAERKRMYNVGADPEPVTLVWKNASGAVEVKVLRSADGHVVFVTNAMNLASAQVVNLEIAQDYTWTVKDATGDATAHFKTEDHAPRFMQIDKIPNIRDLGGRIGLDGRRVRQGLVYRSAGLNENANRVYLKNDQLLKAVKQGGDALEKLLAGTTDLSLNPTDVQAQAARVRAYYKKDGKLPDRYLKRYLVKDRLKPGAERLTDATRAYMTQELGIRTDLDLRSKAECFGMTGSPLGPGVQWVHLPSSSYGGMSESSARKTFAAVFRVFLDRKNYPIDFHCIAGADRTGAVAFILNALLGVDEDELYRDWETTGFRNTTADFCHAKRFDKLVAVFDKYPGSTIHARVAAYVKSLGFTDADLATFRDIMLEPKK